MTTLLKTGLMSIAVVMAFAGLSTPAKADDGYCREYTRTVNIGGRTQDAYGTACLQPDGSWMIVGEGLGNDIPDNVNDVQYVIHDNRRNITPTRVVYYDRSPVIYRSRNVTPVFIWNHNGFYRGGHYVPYQRQANWNRYDNRYGNHGRDYSWNDRDHDNRRDNNGRGRH